MVIENSIKIGDLLTAASVFIGVIGFAISSFRDRRLRRKDYADRIRVAAATTAVAVDRWAELASRIYDDIQALILDTDVLLVKKQDVIETRDLLWRGLVDARALSSRRILDEKLDSAYVGLYGYAPDVQELYTMTLNSLKQADDFAYDRLLQETQKRVMDRSMAKKPFQSAELGNLLREKIGQVEKEFNSAAAKIVAVFRSRMMSLINASDSEIFHKTYPRFSKSW